jgi:hypothetical protein
MWLKILIEVPIGIVVLVLALPLWNIFKSRAYIAAVLRNPVELASLLDVIGIDRLQSDARALPTVWALGPDSWMFHIYCNTVAHFKALAYTRRRLLFLIAAAIAGSAYFLGIGFGIFNLALLLAMAIPEISAPAKRCNLELVYIILVNLYRWSSDDPQDASRFCPSAFTGALATVRRAIPSQEVAAA